MRFYPSFLAVAFLLVAQTAAAQDRFGSVTVEPRPDEYMHWNAEAFAEVRDGLEERLAGGERIFGTLFVFERVLQATDDRPHNISIVHREGYTQPEIHEYKWDLYVIAEGSGTLLVGGERTNWIDDGRPDDQQRPGLGGAQAFHVEEGDVVHVPARVWHQVVLDEGQAMTYMLINVMEDWRQSP